METSVLIGLLKQDRRKAISLLFEAHYANMCKMANRIVSDTQLAEDIVQEIFLKLYENSSALEKADSLPAYLKRMATNRAIDHYRKQSRVKKVDLDQQFDLNTQESTDQDLHAQETKSAIKVAIDSLPEQCRIVFLLKRKEGFTNQEVATHLGISVKTVENQMTKALKRLKTSLSPFLSLMIGFLKFFLSL